MAETRESQKRKGRPRLSLSEKKRRQTFRETERDLSRIRLGDQFARWRKLMEELGLSSNTEMAKLLLDSYEVTNKVAKDEPKHAKPLASTSSCFTSTPGRVLLRHTKRLKTPSVSEVSLIDSGSEPHVSGVEMMGTDSSTFEDNGKRELAQRRFNRAGRTVEKKQLSDSFVDPFNLTIDVSEATDGDESDPEYEPSFNITAVLPDEVNDAVEEMAYEEVEFGMELETWEMEESESESENEDIGPGVDKIRNEQDCQRLSETTVAKQKENGVLLQWSEDIINHFWFSCKTASNYEQFLSIWRSVLHHITNKHEWILSHGQGINKCLHEPLSENEERKKPWLDPKKDAKVLKTLAQVLLDQRFLKRVDYYLNFRSTAELEVFHQHILMYCAKRFAYTPPVYRIRNELAALDHNIHSDRGVMRNKEGEIVYHRCYNKKSGRWTVYPCKEKKTYPHIRDLVQKALICRLEDKQGMRRRRELMEDDPRRIGRNLAPEEPPSTQVLVKEKISRF